MRLEVLLFSGHFRKQVRRFPSDPSIAIDSLIDENTQLLMSSSVDVESCQSPKPSAVTPLTAKDTDEQHMEVKEVMWRASKKYQRNIL